MYVRKKLSPEVWEKMSSFSNRGRISSVGRALDCRAGGRGFNSRDRTNTQGLAFEMTEKWRYYLCPANGIDTQIEFFFFREPANQQRQGKTRKKQYET